MANQMLFVKLRKVRNKQKQVMTNGKINKCSKSHIYCTTTADPWTVPNIDISLRRQLASTYSSLVDKISKGNQKKWEKSGVNISKPKVFDKNTEKRIPFVTFFRSPSARTARIQVIREGSCLHEVYKPAGPHVFRRDDFHFVYGTEIGKPRFVSSYNRDHGKLDLPKKYVSVDAGEDSTTGSTHCKDVKVYSKPFVTSLKPRPTWDHRLILKKEKYVRGSSENMENRLERPDVKDFITLDWLKVTKYDKISN
ncbi:uncharacterized protein LOC124440019 isoform X2 [Xenia sp. Carnegie-2017]|uniref:uncharacterized protein LOC124440019 isoform X2 n=1 Tax=Xenia sp. Carnegie-2017 TaxID=2897299 RepID=UPI001F04BE44|nr:uncharacterized protein LOC124440019 isoform X2 [Xenia sp. Carnegie-2017]